MSRERSLPDTPDSAEALEYLSNLMQEAEIGTWGIAASGQDADQEAADYRQWIDQGRHGSMDFLERHEPMKFRPEDIVPGARSVIVMAISYYDGKRRGWSVPSGPARPGDQGWSVPSGPARPGDQGWSVPSGRISRYALGRDYHREFGSRIKNICRQLEARFPGHSFRGFTDTAPLHERFYAWKAGISFTGRNTLSMNSELGSWFFLGEIITSMELPESPKTKAADSHCPGGCRRCIDICPTSALQGPHRIDASRCISYLTIEHKGTIADELMDKMGSWVFGCDLCQDVCPFNIRAAVSPVAAWTRPRLDDSQELGRLLALENHEQFTGMFASTPVMRAGWESMLRNAVIAAANLGALEHLPRIRQLSGIGYSETIRYTAHWALEKLAEKPE